MLFEIGSSVVMGGVVAYTYLAQSGGTNEAAKIQRICANSGLVVKEKGDTKTIHLQRRTRKKWGTEYVYRIPLGLSFNDFQKKLEHLQDGLNNKKNVLDLSFDDLKELKLNRDIIKQIKNLFNKKKKIKKEIELSYDGMLKIRVYNEPLTELFPFDEKLFDKCKEWEIPIGVMRTELIKHNFEQICHLVVAGTTRYGKTVFLKNLITTLVNQKPRDVRFTLIDLKGGLAFSRFKDLSQVRSVAKNAEESLDALREIQVEMNKRMELFLEQGYEDVKESGFKERHFIVIDEAAQLASAGETDKEIKKMKVESENIVAEIARIGGGLGYRIIFATQYPTADTLPRQVKQNCDAKLCFKLQTDTASQVVLDESGAEELPLIKGRAIYLTDQKRIIQTPFIENDFIERIISPHIVIKPRKDDSDGKGDYERTEGGSDTLIIEETGLS